VIHDDFDAREPSRHIFEHRHLMRQDVEIEHRAQSFRFTPERHLQQTGSGYSHPRSAVGATVTPWQRAYVEASASPTPAE